jgi:hypothetical protein
MSTVRLDTSVLVSHQIREALGHLQTALNLIDEFDRPEIGARLQEVIDAVQAMEPSGAVS